MNLILLVFIFVLTAFLGTALISKVPSQLHTPLMSATNAISGITVIGALVACAVFTGETGTVGKILAFIAIILASINLVGGFMVTERMLGMFRSSPRKKEDKN